MRHLALVALVLAGFVLLFDGGRPTPAAAQITAAAADSADVVLATAQAFEAEGEWAVAEALYHFITERWNGTPAADVARSRLGEARVEGVGRGGQVELQVWTTAYGLWLGVAVPAAFGAEDPEPYGLGLLLGGPAGFFGGRALARNRALSPGQVRAITLGGTWGTWQGLGWAEVFDFGEEEVCDDFGCFDTGDSSEEVFASMVVGGLAGVATGAVLARRPLSHASVTAVNHGALWGTWLGLATGVLTDLDDEEDGLLAASLIGGNVGLVGTAVLAPRLGWSRQRYRVVSLAGVIGALGGVGIDLLTTPDSEKTAIGIPLATSLLGLGIGVAATRDYDRAGAAGGFGGTPQGSGDAFTGALLLLRDGELELGAPVPTPRVVELDTPDLRRSVTLGFTLLRLETR